MTTVTCDTPMSETGDHTVETLQYKFRVLLVSECLNDMRPMHLETAVFAKSHSCIVLPMDGQSACITAY